MKFFSLVIKLLLVSFIFSISIYGQQKDREIKRTVWKNEPIKIVNIKVKNKTVKLKEKFVENDDWLKDCSIEVENISSQAILYLEVDLSFPQDENGLPKAPATEVLKYGAVPPKVNNSEPTILPGERITLKLDSYESLQALLKYAGHPKDIKEVTVRIGDVYFADGTKWSSGQILKRDPYNPRTWRVEPKQVSLNKQIKLLDVIAFNKERINFKFFFAMTNLSNMKFPIPKGSAPDENGCLPYDRDEDRQCNNYACHAEKNIKL